LTVGASVATTQTVGSARILDVARILGQARMIRALTDIYLNWRM
jgi:hypothetical protein